MSLFYVVEAVVTDGAGERHVERFGPPRVIRAKAMDNARDVSILYGNATVYEMPGGRICAEFEGGNKTAEYCHFTIRPGLK